MRLYIIIIVDIDECQDLTLCFFKPNEECVNTEGSYICQCMVGYMNASGCMGKLIIISSYTRTTTIVTHKHVQ